jgi:hypothetical protein
MSENENRVVLYKTVHENGEIKIVKPERKEKYEIRYETIYDNGEYEILEWEKIPYSAEVMQECIDGFASLANEILEHCEQSIPGISNLWSVDSDNIKLEKELEFGRIVYTTLIPFKRKINNCNNESNLQIYMNHFQGLYNMHSLLLSHKKGEFIVTLYPTGNEWSKIPNLPNPIQQIFNIDNLYDISISNDNMNEFVYSYIVETERNLQKVGI